MCTTLDLITTIRKNLFLLIAGLITTGYVSAQPIISSFSPASGPVGTSVIITGTGFGATPNDNIVFFGAVRANVTSASATSLTVTVPAGATYEPISITVNALTGFSARPFAVTFPGGGSLLATSFETRIDSGTGPSPRSLVISDLDGDQKPDVAAVSNGNVPATVVTIHRNTGSSGVIAFAPRIDLPLGNFGVGLAAADFDGDGKPDLAASYIDNNGNVSIFKNNSSPGNISFAAPVTYPAANSPYTVLAKDIDLDGKPDLIISNYTNNSISILRNTSTGGVISFAPKMEILTNLAPYSVAAGDLDNDKKIDIAVTNSTSYNISVYRNTSSVGNISFAARVDYPAGIVPTGIAIGDADDDGKEDIVFVNTGDKNVSVMRNTSTSGALSFAGRVNFALSPFSGEPMDVELNDLDGDTRVDLLVGIPLNTVTVMKNTSTTGTISFAGSNNHYALSPHRIAVGDLDLDSKPDIAVTNSANASFTVFRNRANEPYIISFTPESSVAGGTVTITGNNFTGVTAVSFGGVAAASFTVVNATTINAVVGAGGSGDVVVTNPYGSSTKSGFTFNAPPQITSFTPTFSGTGDTITITGSFFTGVTAVSFGGVPAASFTVISFNSIRAVVGEGASGSVNVTNPYGTGSLAGYVYYPPPTITSFTPTSGGMGTNVTISGTFFAGATSVTIGGAPAASFTVNSPTSIMAIVGEGASGGIAVTTPGGTALSDDVFAFPPPVITSFTPESGPAGSTVTITGANFRSDTAANFVYFGAVRTKVLTATTNSLTVTVPPGATYQRISIAANNHTQFAGKPFRLTFPDKGNGLTDSSFVWKNAFRSYEDPRSLLLADIDGDGRSDIITGNYFSNAIKVLRNTGANGTASFAPEVTIFAGPGSNASIYLAAGDLNSDGKPDIVAGTQTSILMVFENTSSPGAISFAPRLDLSVGYYSRGVVIDDFDGDARADLAIVTVDPFDSNSELTVLRNTGINGKISFAPKTSFSFPGTVFSMKSADFNGDGKPDLAAGNAEDGTAIFKNNSTPGNLSFDAPVYFPGSISNGYGVICIADIDGDEKPDICSIHPTGFSVLRNTSSGATISFAAPVIIAATSQVQDAIVAGQLDGDGKPDVLVVADKLVAASRNTSTPGTISFDPPIILRTKVTYNWTYDAAIGDLEGDGKPDLVVTNGPDNKVSVFRNQINELVDSVCEGANINLTADIAGTSYQWYENRGNGFASLTNNANFAGANTATLQINNVPLAWNNFQYYCLVDGNKSSIVNLIVNPVITPAAKITAPAQVCAGDVFGLVFEEIVTGNVPYMSGLQVWHSIDGGPFTAVFTQTYYASPARLNVQYNTGSTVKFFIRMLSPEGFPCVETTHTDTITVVIGEMETPAITANGYTITVTNPDAAAQYSWQYLNTNVNVWENISPAATGTTYKVLVPGTYRVKGTEATCVSYSNGLLVTTTGIAPVPGGSLGIHAFPNPLNALLTIDTLKLADKWQSLDMVSMDGRKIVSGLDIRNKTRVKVNVVRLRPGVYMVVLWRREGAPAVVKVVKE